MRFELKKPKSQLDEMQEQQLYKADRISLYTAVVGLFAAIIGSLVYRFIVALAIKFALFPPYMLKLVSALIVALALAVPAFAIYMNRYKIKREVKINAEH